MENFYGAPPAPPTFSPVFGSMWISPTFSPPDLTGTT